MRVAIRANDQVLGWLADQVERPPRRFRLKRRVPPDQLRCHPDLCDRLHAMGAGLPGSHEGFLTGLPVLMHPNAVIYAVAGGASWIALRLPPHVHRAVVRSEWGTRGLVGEWVDVDPWMTDVEAHEGLRRLRGWARAAYELAGTLSPPPAGMRPPSMRRGSPR